MYGRYSRQLGEFAKLEALRQQEKRRIKEEKARKKELRGYQGIHHLLLPENYACNLAFVVGKLSKTFSYLWKHTFAKLGEDWVFLALLGVIMAVLSFMMDRGISMCNKGNSVKLTLCASKCSGRVLYARCIVTMYMFVRGAKRL